LKQGSFHAYPWKNSETRLHSFCFWNILSMRSV
jgi:hypothetical protein